MDHYVCQECGAESADPRDAQARFCRVCDTSEREAQARLRERVRLAMASEARDASRAA